MSYVMVTGAAGFIGSKLVESLLRSGSNVIAIDCFLPNLYANETKIIRWKNLIELESDAELLQFKFDLRIDDFSVFSQYEIQVVYNLAAMPGLIKNWGDFRTYYECNLYALNRLLEFTKHLELRSFVQASTSSVYGRSAVGNEDMNLSPISPYGISKLAAEKLSLAYLDRYGIPAKILRYFSVYGPGQRPDMAYAKIFDAINRGDVFHIYGDGTQRRSNTYIDDIVEATVLSDISAGVGSILNICGDECISLNDVISLIEELSGKTLRKSFQEMRPGDQIETRGNNSRAREILGWRAKTPITLGLQNQFHSIT